MPLVPMSRLLRHARARHYAVGYFEAWNLESILAVKDAAEEADSPVILGFNGGFLEDARRSVEENLYHYGALGRAIAGEARVPASLILNEGAQVPMLVKALRAGFNVVMHDHEKCSPEESLDTNRYLVRTAHAMDAEVEAELGELPAHDSRTRTESRGRKTDPEAAADFVRRTGVDALAVAVGNVHMLEGRKAGLDLQLIRTLRERLEVPLALHGGTGIEPDALREAIRLGIAKINVGTALRRAFLSSLEGWFRNHDAAAVDPNEATSAGGPDNLLLAARRAITAEVLAMMRAFGSAGMGSRLLKEDA
jgi:fructose-bisphosphate aldolase class II